MKNEGEQKLRGLKGIYGFSPISNVIDVDIEPRILERDFQNFMHGRVENHVICCMFIIVPVSLEIIGEWTYHNKGTKNFAA